MSSATPLEKRPFRLEDAAKLIFLSLFSLFTVYPVLWVFKMAFSPAQGFDSSLNPIPSNPSLSNFAHLFFERPFVTWLFNSALVSAATTLLGVFLACTAAYALSRFRFPGRATMMLSFLVTQMFPGVLMMIPLYLIMDTLGLLDLLVEVRVPRAVRRVLCARDEPLGPRPRQLEQRLVSGEHVADGVREDLPTDHPRLAVRRHHPAVHAAGRGEVADGAALGHVHGPVRQQLVGQVLRPELRRQLGERETRVGGPGVRLGCGVGRTPRIGRVTRVADDLRGVLARKARIQLDVLGVAGDQPEEEREDQRPAQQETGVHPRSPSSLR